MPVKPPIAKKQYSHQLHGVYGQFGSGAGIHAFYLQSALTPAQLDWVSLISDIRGSERWPVSDLFQRDVDNDRITNSLLPYLQDADKIKFFNPLTLTLLPMQDDDDLVLTQMPRAVESSIQKDGNDWDVIERPNYHCVRWIHDNPQYAVLEWSDVRTKLVAIDGKHLLSALKRFRNDRESILHPNFRSWRIPVVVVSFRAGTEQTEPPSVLDVVRNIFVYINTQAQKVNRTRQILLSDESVNAVCTQELVQLAHANDLAPSDDRIHGRLPLLFYDWRGEESEKRRIHAPAAVKNIEEIHDWFENYILGENFSDGQEIALGIDPAHRLHDAFHDGTLNHADSKLLRELARQEVLPAVAYLLENFDPYRSYVTALRELEQVYEQQERSDLARHAFYELRFGTNLAPESVKRDVENLLHGLKEQIEDLKGKWLHSPIDLDIGMRGIACAFGKLHHIFGRPAWLEYAKWFIEALNSLYDDGWLDLRRAARKRRLLLHIIEDHNETVVNYRLEHAESALGAYLQLLITAYGWPLPEEWRSGWPVSKDELLETLRARILRGYKKQVRPQLRPDYPDGGRPLTDAVNSKAVQLAGNHIRRLERELEKIEGRRVKVK